MLLPLDGLKLDGMLNELLQRILLLVESKLHETMLLGWLKLEGELHMLPPRLLLL